MLLPRSGALRLLAVGVLVNSALIRLCADPAAAVEAMDATLDTRAGTDLEWHQGWDRASSAGVPSGSLSLTSETAIAGGQISPGGGIAFAGGFQYTRIGLSVGSAVPLPGRLQSEGLGFGAVWRPQHDFGALVQLLPAFSGESGGLSSRSFNLTGLAQASWLRGDVLWEAGVQFDTLGKYPIFPCGGLVYGLTRELSLQLLFPQSRIAYDLGGGWSAYLGANFEYQSFRMDSSFGTGIGRPQLNNSALSYEETSWGPGVTYKLRNAVTFDVMLGQAASRSFEFFRAKMTVEPKSSACVRASIVALF